MPKNPNIKKVLVLGSGPIVIGQAAEFDYAGTQACRALKEEGIEVVLVNSNPATIMTDKDIADHVYIEPLNIPSVTQVIEKEKPDSILPTLGGQTGLNLAMALYEDGTLEKYGVKLLGTSPDSIRKAEDRQGFKDCMESIGQPCVTSEVVESVEDAVAFAEKIVPKGTLNVVTPSLKVSMLLSAVGNVNIIQLGGVVHKKSLSVRGTSPLISMEEFSCSKLFIGADGINEEYGVTNSNLEEAQLNREMMKAASKTIVLVDSSKFSRKGFGRICPLSQIHTVVTDGGIHASTVRMLEEQGVEVIIAE